ncbi:TerB family tellurite resistance protein [Flavobacteriaceae bacterium]|nr:TerB family tellurite resistance protein [Flavobacteriaceae bacterium]
MIKWVAAFMGFYLFRIPGALLGFFIGGMIDQFNGSNRTVFQTRFSANPSGSLQLNLLALAATVIKADGVVKGEELQFVRNFFISNYGSQQSSEIFETFNEQIKKEVQNIAELSRVFVDRTPYETRLQVLYFLFGVANADGNVAQSELDKISQIAVALGIRSSSFESIKAMFFQNTDSAYKILEIPTTASDMEVKKAYRQMAKKYHPDKLQSQDSALVKGAQEKFQEVQKAYESIQKERGL